MAYEEYQGTDIPTTDERANEKPTVLAGDVQTLPMTPLADMGANVYRYETRRDSVTGKLRTPAEAKGLSTTRTNKDK